MKIVLENPNFDDIDIDVNESDKVGHVKTKIEESLGVSVDFQHLLFVPTTKSYGCVSNSTGTFLALDDELLVTDNAEVKREALRNARHELDDSRTLAEYGINLKSCDQLTLCLSMHKTIFVQDSDGMKTPMIVRPWDTVKYIKDEIFKVNGIPVHLMQLALEGVELEDDSFLLNYNLKPNSTVDLNVRMWIFVDTSEEKPLKLNVKPEDTVEEVKNRIKKMKGLPVKWQLLTFMDTELEDDNTLGHYKVHHYSTPILKVCSRKEEDPDVQVDLAQKHGQNVTKSLEMQILVSISNSKIVSLIVNSSDTVEDVKKKIEKSQGLAVNEQHLVFKPFIGKDVFAKTATEEIISIDDDIKSNGDKLYDNLVDTRKELENDRPLSDYCLHLFSSPLLNLSLSGEMTIFVQHPTQKRTTLVVKPWDTVKAVMEQLQEQEGTPVRVQIMRTIGKTLDKSRRLFDYNIKPSSTIYLELSHPYMWLHIDAPDRKTLNLDVNPEDLIRDVKAKIEQLERIAVKKQSLSFLYEELQDDHTLYDYKIHLFTAPRLTLRTCHEIEVVVNSFTGKSLPFRISSWDTVLILKHMIFEKEGIPVDEQRLMFIGQHLKDERTLENYQIGHCSSLLLVSPIRGKDV